MKRFTRTLRTLALALAVTGLGACTEAASPVAPETESSEGLFSSLLPGLVGGGSMDVVERTTPLADTLTASAVIGWRGGVIEIPEAGLRFVVPRGALRTPTEITVTAPAGDLVGYHFAPHGLNFRRPARIIQSTVGTELESSRALLRLARGAYFAGPLAPTIDALELFNLQLLPGLTRRVTFPVDHFSGYVIAMN